MKDNTVNFFSLLASSSTLICCALPSIFVALGAGASFASLVSSFTILISFSQYKLQISLVAFVVIIISGYVNYVTYQMPCPADPELGRACMQTRKRSRLIYYSSVAIFIFATIFTYFIPLFL